MHDEYFTDKNVMMLLDRLTFRGRSFSATMKYYGIGFICVGLLELILSATGTLSLLFKSKMFVICVSILITSKLSDKAIDIIQK